MPVGMPIGQPRSNYIGNLYLTELDFSVPGHILSPANSVPSRGSDRMRPLYRHYYGNSDAVIWMVNACSSPAELYGSGSQLHSVLNEPQLSMVPEGLPVLILVIRLEASPLLGIAFASLLSCPFLLKDPGAASLADVRRALCLEVEPSRF